MIGSTEKQNLSWIQTEKSKESEKKTVERNDSFSFQTYIFIPLEKKNKNILLAQLLPPLIFLRLIFDNENHFKLASILRTVFTSWENNIKRKQRYLIKPYFTLVLKSITKSGVVKLLRRLSLRKFM